MRAILQSGHRFTWLKSIGSRERPVALRVPDEQPLRAELFSAGQLAGHAASIAQRHAIAARGEPRRGKDLLLPRLASNEKILCDAYELIAGAVTRGRRITPAAEWFLDNFHLIEEQIRTARKHLPKGYSRELPRLTHGATAGYPRVYDIALELISHVDGRFDAETVQTFITSYQTASPLRLGELWAIPIMLRLALLENLRRVATRLASGRRDRERASYWAERMLETAGIDPKNVVLVLADMVNENPPLTNAFVSEFASQMHGQPAASSFPMTWFEQRLAEQGESLEQVFQQASQNQAADQVSVGNSITSLRILSAIDWRDFVEATSSVEQILRTDPVGAYPAMDFATRDQYRHAIEQIARQSTQSEDQVAQKAIELSQRNGPERSSHVGYLLIDRGRPLLEHAVAIRMSLRRKIIRWAGNQPLTAYVGSIAIAVTVLTGLVLRHLHDRMLGFSILLVLAILLLVCISQLAVSLVQWAVGLMVSPRILPRMDFSKGIAPDYRTIVAVPTMLTDMLEIDTLLESLEIRFLANRDPSLCFALLTDFRDAVAQKLPEDAALLDHARSGIDGLNRKYINGDGTHIGFFLFHRPRRWNPQEGVWMGWERKRGKLEEFNAALRGRVERFDTIAGPIESLGHIRYVIALDSDTQLPRESARQLIGTMAHPLNRPFYDAKLGRVTEGYSILQPRVGISMSSARRSQFARLFAGEPGIDPYSRAASDVYQDLFDEGSFIGKGIYDVDAFEQAIGSRFPENRVLSHDLLEGAYARSGLVSDVILYEDFPSAYLADVSRRSRWIRGDWQIAGWLLSRVSTADGSKVPNPLSAVSRWKIFDNLRRSLVPPSLLLLLIVGWLTHQATTLISLIVLAIVLFPSLLITFVALIRRPDDLLWAQHARLLGRTLLRHLFQELFSLACLPYDAYFCTEAIARTTARLFTGRKLLEWRTALDAQRNSRADLAGFYVTMWVLPVTATVCLLLLSLLHLPALKWAIAAAMLWFIAPCIAWWLSRPLRPARIQLTADDSLFLQAIARRTWRFFETFIGHEDHFLPPDNFQEDPPNGAAHRTSPTNIGLSLLSNLAAYDFGYIPISITIDRAKLALATLDRLQRYRGHFFNWYDTHSLEPLRPLYVSTVDSGNLVGHLLTLASGLEEIRSAPIILPTLMTGLDATLQVAMEEAGKTKDSGTDGILTTLAQLRQMLGKAPDTLSATHILLQLLISQGSAIVSRLNLNIDQELNWWVEAFIAQCQQFSGELVHLCPWIALPSPTEPVANELRELLRPLDHIATFSEVAAMELTVLPAIDEAKDKTDWLKSLRSAVIQGAEYAAQRLSDLQQVAACCREFAEIDYDFLYDKARHLLAIGFNVDDRRLDDSFYDLLASEARLASFIAIAQGKLPQEHWFSLGRSLTTSVGRPALLSWSGSMFEYLMPLLVMPSYEQTLLDETYRAVVERQIQYGNQRSVPWGISESGYSKTDAQLNYQYRAFGVPGLGFKRGLADDLVIAPYATAMALMVDAQSSSANLRRLSNDGYLGRYGFYEAIDYTTDRLPPGQKSHAVRSFMAHHQGMAFLSFAYLLLDKPMQRRFESDPSFRATDLLLQERVPKMPPIYPHPAEVSQARGTHAETQPNIRVYTNPNGSTPQVHLLSNGRYHVAVTAGGGGYSRWHGLAVTRWLEDATRDNWGAFCYIRDVQSGEFWSTAHQPTLKAASNYEAVYSQGRAEYQRKDGDIETHTEISVSPEDDIELRRISLSNRGSRSRSIELTSYSEVVLASPAADAAHPAFSNLFVQTEILRAQHAILCTRRPRSASERPPFMFHLMTFDQPVTQQPSYETGRAEFIGRGRSTVDPAAMHHPKLTDSEGSVLDPIVAIRTVVTLAPDETVWVNLVTGIAETREAAVSLIEKYQDPRLAERVFELAWTHSQVVLRQLDAAEADTLLYSRLASSILNVNPLLRAPASVLTRNRSGQSGLWGYGISGDLPIVLLRISDQTQMNLVRQMVGAHAYWRVKGLAVDLVIWNEDQSGYRQLLHDQILAVIGTRNESSLLDKPAGIFLRRVEQMSEEDKVLMQTVARIIVSDTAGTLAEQTDRRARAEVPVPRFIPVRPRSAEVPTAVEVLRQDLVANNGIGGFTSDGREYVITTTNDQRTPAPWVNVIANPWFGTVVSESGAAYTWCENAQSYRLTPWYNDWVSDSSGEAFYIRDEESGRFWSPSPLPVRGAMPYTTRHGFGYSIFQYSEGGITTEMCIYVATDAPIKFITFKVSNDSGRARKLSLTGFFELVLGERRPATLMHVVTEMDTKSGALLARNSYNGDFSNRIAFLDCSESQRTVTGDRTEFLGRNGSAADPACMTRTRLSGRVGASLDPCAAMQVMIDLADGQNREITFTFGTGRDLNDARNLVTRFRGNGPARIALENVWGYWNRTLGAVHVETPDASVNFLTNGWLLYQTLACRLWARSGFYQSGGAYGYRDQLQDVMALAHTEPAILRAQLLRSASRQFREGDVQHWWHPPMGRGVRTRISDDYLWLPYATCRYIAALGDVGVLDEKAKFLDGRLLKADEESYYDLPNVSDESATLYEHCVRSIKNGLRFGEHGLPLMGSGDWNDGMNLVGEHGKGESIWLAFFLYDVLMKFSQVAKNRQDAEFAERCMTEAGKLKQNIEQHAWDGQWYTRAFFDNGELLGSASSMECRIDSLPQSWSVLSNAGDPARSIQALQQVDQHLVDRELNVIRLFDPAFDKSDQNPGYIKGYVPGVRENGGQYTHAAIWTIMAFAQSGQTERAWELFNLINPVHHGDSAAAIERYKVEPYVIAADVYTNPQHAGRGGWTWYTGSAGWMYRLITESLLGLHLEVNRLRLAPRMPESWPSFTIHYRYRETFHRIHVRRAGSGQMVNRVTFDGVDQPDKTIPLMDNRSDHHAYVEIGQ